MPERNLISQARRLLPSLALATLSACGRVDARAGNDGSRARRDAGLVPLDSGSRIDMGSVSSGARTDSGARADSAVVTCGAQFPSFDRKCEASSDCTIVSHQTDCCGSIAYLAIAAAEAQRFDGIETRCRSGYGFCGCPPAFTTTLDDGVSVSDPADVAAECEDGECRSRFNGPTFGCGNKTCTGVQYCLASDSVDPFAPDGGGSTYACISEPSCITSCDVNPCRLSECTCEARSGHVTLDCKTAPSGSSCSDLSAAAEKVIDDAFVAATAPAELSCSSDADCVIQFSPADCTSGCSAAVVSTTGMTTVDAALQLAALGPCALFDSNGCVRSQPPCPMAPTQAACMNGTCVDFPPATWLSLTAVVATGSAAMNPQYPANCDPGQDCTLWRVFPDGSMLKSIDDAPLSPAALSPSDFSTIDGILRSQSFRQIFASGTQPVCPTAPAGTAVLFDLQNRFWQETFDFTGCVLSDPGSDVATLYGTVRKY